VRPGRRYVKVYRWGKLSKERVSHAEGVARVESGKARAFKVHGDEIESIEMILPKALPPLRAQSIEDYDIESAYLRNSNYQRERINRYGEVNRVELESTGIATKEFIDAARAKDKPLDPTVRLSSD
jgi:hypothetical protein